VPVSTTVALGAVRSIKVDDPSVWADTDGAGGGLGVPLVAAGASLAPPPPQPDRATAASNEARPTVNGILILSTATPKRTMLTSNNGSRRPELCDATKAEAYVTYRRGQMTTEPDKRKDL
jgi:hypothetical protein